MDLLCNSSYRRKKENDDEQRTFLTLSVDFDSNKRTASPSPIRDGQLLRSLRLALLNPPISSFGAYNLTISMTDTAESATNNDLAEQQHQKRQRAVADDLVCVITHELPFDPVTAEDGRLYERSAIEEHIAHTQKQGHELKSPITNEPMGSRLFGSPQIKSLIETLIESRSITGELADTWKIKQEEKKRASELLRKAESGDAKSMLSVYCIYKEGMMGFKKDRKLAYQWAKRAHEAGNVKATALLGYNLLFGLDVPENQAEGLVLTTMAAKDGSNFAAYRLGCAFALGQFGLSVDKAQAIVWLEKALDPKCTYDHLKNTGRENASTLYAELMDNDDNEDSE